MKPDERPEIRPAANRTRVVALRLFFALLAVAAAVYYLRPVATFPQDGMGQKPGKPEDMPVPVAVENVIRGDFPVYLTGLGTVTPLRTVTVRTRVDGEIVKIAFTEGQMVKQGDLLAEIDPRPFQAQLQQAEGQLMRDEALLKNAEVDLTRYKTLLEQDSIDAKTAVTQEYLVKQYRGTVENDRGQVANARLQLTYARVTAPVAGRVGLRLVDQGNIVHASDGNGLAVITQIQPITVIFTLPEDEVPAVMKRWHPRQDISVEAYDRAGRTRLATGKLLAVDNQIDPATGTFKLRAQFDNDEKTLFSNQFVNVKMRLDTLTSATIMPSAAVQHGANGSFAYAVKSDGAVVMCPLKLGPAEGEKVVVLEGLVPDETVVVDGADKLREGAKVEVMRRNEAPVRNKPDGGPPAQSGGKGKNRGDGPQP